MEPILRIDDADVSSIVHLLGEISGSTANFIDRRRQLMHGLVQLIDGDTWMWLATRNSPSSDGDASAFFIMDGGWIDQAERDRLWHLNTLPEPLIAVATGIDFTQHITYCYDEHHPGWQEGRIMDKYLRPAGFGHLMFSYYPLGDQTISAMGIHRRVGRQPFTARDQSIVHLITGQIDWLHREGTNVPANKSSLTTLSSRQREVLIHLLGGNSRKQIARKLSLSEHTVGDHVKDLYLRLSVNSNTELLALFLPETSKRIDGI